MGRLLMYALLGDRAKRSVIAETFENAGADIEEAAVQPQIAFRDRPLDPGKRQKIGKRQAHRFMLADPLLLLGPRLKRALARRLGKPDQGGCFRPAYRKAVRGCRRTWRDPRRDDVGHS